MTTAVQTKESETKEDIRKFSIQMTSFMMVMIVENMSAYRIQNPLIYFLTFHITLLLVSLIGYLIYKLLQ
ncbi:hypothetical protein [Bacillus sp. JJ722]|uniref:hypothetical protein n=1 Tax=Bacillus sp. JJ722 TaxID=3122973 RepID=UPI003000EE84